MDAHDHGDAEPHAKEPFERSGDPERDAERAATVGGYAGAVLGARGGPIGAGIGAFLGGSTGYAVGYALSEMEAANREEFDGGDAGNHEMAGTGSDAADDGPVTINVESEGEPDIHADEESDGGEYDEDDADREGDDDHAD